MLPLGSMSARINSPQCPPFMLAGRVGQFSRGDMDWGGRLAVDIQLAGRAPPVPLWPPLQAQQSEWISIDLLAPSQGLSTFVNGIA